MERSYGVAGFDAKGGRQVGAMIAGGPWWLHLVLSVVTAFGAGVVLSVLLRGEDSADRLFATGLGIALGLVFWPLPVMAVALLGLWSGIAWLAKMLVSGTDKAYTRITTRAERIEQPDSEWKALTKDGKQ